MVQAHTSVQKLAVMQLVFELAVEKFCLVSCGQTVFSVFICGGFSGETEALRSRST